MSPASLLIVPLLGCEVGKYITDLVQLIYVYVLGR